MVTTLFQSTTLNQFLALPEAKPASEYFHQSISQKPMPQGQHSVLQSELVTLINQWAKPSKIAYAFPELQCIFAESVIVPDLTILKWTNIPIDEKGDILNQVRLAPDWTIEIASPGQSHSLLLEKILFCLQHGTQLGWLIDPETRRIMTLDQQQRLSTKRGEDILQVLAELGTWEITVKSIFALLNFA